MRLNGHQLTMTALRRKANRKIPKSCESTGTSPRNAEWQRQDFGVPEQVFSVQVKRRHL